MRAALAHQVFDRLTPARLAAIARLGDRELAWCDELTGHFFTFFELTKLWSVEALRTAISEGVEKELFAYSVGVSAENGGVRVSDPSLVRVGGSLMPDEVDLGPGTALLSLGAARAALPVPAEDEPSTPGVTPSPAPPVPAPTTPPLGSDSADADRVGGRTVWLEIDATEDDLFTIQKALGGLRSVVDPGQLKIRLSVEGSRPDGLIDPIQYHNRVRQHLEEDEDVRFEERWE